MVCYLAHMVRFSLCFLLLGAAALAQPPTQGDRDYTVSALQATRKEFLDILVQVTPAQWNWKPAPNVWSIAEVAEHITAAETFFPQVAKKAMAGPAEPDKKKPNPRQTDEMLMKMVPARDRKFQAPEPIQPKSRFATKAELVVEFKKDRDANIAYIRETSDSLRDHFAPNPAVGELDALQWYTFMAAHTERHLNQIRELEANPQFPKSGASAH